MRQFRTSGSVGAPGSDPRGHPTLARRSQLASLASPLTRPFPRDRGKGAFESRDLPCPRFRGKGPGIAGDGCPARRPTRGDHRPLSGGRGGGVLPAYLPGSGWAIGAIVPLVTGVVLAPPE